MIKAFLFDLDGTLVETEHLKAVSYARAAYKLCPNCATEEEITQAFKDVVGDSRQVVAENLMERFHLEEAASKYMDQFHVNTPWQAFLQIRMQIFDEMLNNPENIKKQALPNAIDILKTAHESGCKIGLTTTSDCEHTTYILQTLGILDYFDFIGTADDVEHTKPDPEVYRLVTKQIGVPPEECIALEDSLTGVQAALAAGAHCIAVTTEFTRTQVHSAHMLEDRWIVDDSAKLSQTVLLMIDELGGSCIPRN